ncbi:MAG TPA: hypothetical protein VLU43_14275 [Anaeromyxobacteraceae bacterium]|nr:hypothetical protein [Anaeromyxobacteraceae bacterium]
MKTLALKLAAVLAALSLAAPALACGDRATTTAGNKEAVKPAVATSAQPGAKKAEKTQKKNAKPVQATN